MGARLGQDERGPSYVTLDLAQLQERPPLVAVSPGPSLCVVAADVAGSNRGSPAQWIKAARAALEPGDLAVLAPIAAPPGALTPGRVAVTGADASSDIDEELERIATLPIEYLLDDIAFTYGSSPPPPWDVVARRPRQWLVRYSQALARIWSAMREPWAAAAVLVEREIERVELATARGALPELMATLHHRAEVRDGQWRLADEDGMALHIPERGLVISPVLGGPGAARATYNEDGFLRAISYALPGAPRLLDGELLPPARAIEALLGAQRTTILRLLDQPMPAGQLAPGLVTTPSAVTHHLRALEVAGLIVRERSGRHVIVHRTARGSALLGLYDDR